jgi:hypothetical protein
MGRRVDQQRNQFVKAVKAVRVAMRHHKRHRARTGAPLMNEVKARTVDCGDLEGFAHVHSWNAR